MSGHLASECELVLIPVNKVADIWPLVHQLIEDAAHKLEICDIDILIDDLLTAKALLWVGCQGDDVMAAMVTQVTKVHGTKYCTIVALGGHDRQMWLPFLADIEHYAHDQGCKAMRLLGRPGWSRVLTDYKVIGYIIQKELS